METDFRHQGCIYGSDAEFLAMAVPFAEDGLRRGEPVLVTTTAANLELLHEVLGADADKIDYAESAYFGRRAPQRAYALRQYWLRHRANAPVGTVRILAEPVWNGRSQREVAAWQRMEAGLNVLLADTRIWMICPYDTRVVEAGIIEDAHRTHPECLVGRRAEPSAQFMAPEEFARARRSPHPLGTAAADIFRFEGDLVAVRRYVLDKATPLLPSENSVAIFGIAVGEAIAYLLSYGIERAAVWVRPAAGRVVCTLHSDQPLDIHPFVGFLPPRLEEPDRRLWMTSQICEWLDISSDEAGCTIELAMPGLHAEEARHTEGNGEHFEA
ncbi:MAG TPA: MEDS domain-containing protein [Amycolatopsis sp.]|nr:MEDS domain-containing protein [Amycolatopsis sp.]